MDEARDEVEFLEYGVDFDKARWLPGFFCGDHPDFQNRGLYAVKDSDGHTHIRPLSQIRPRVFDWMGPNIEDLPLCHFEQEGKTMLGKVMGRWFQPERKLVVEVKHDDDRVLNHYLDIEKCRPFLPKPNPEQANGKADVSRAFKPGDRVIYVGQRPELSWKAGRLGDVWYFTAGFIPDDPHGGPGDTRSPYCVMITNLIPEPPPAEDLPSPGIRRHAKVRVIDPDSLMFGHHGVVAAQSATEGQWWVTFDSMSRGAKFMGAMLEVLPGAPPEDEGDLTEAEHPENDDVTAALKLGAAELHEEEVRRCELISGRKEDMILGLADWESAMPHRRMCYSTTPEGLQVDAIDTDETLFSIIFIKDYCREAIPVLIEAGLEATRLNQAAGIGAVDDPGPDAA